MNAGRRRFLTSAAALSLAGCGGGGGGSTYIGGPPAAYRAGIQFGYYGDDIGQAGETADHASLYMSAPWDGLAPSAITKIASAKAAGFRELLVMPQAQVPNGMGGWRWGTVEETLEAIYGYMATLQAAGALEDINLAGLYWCDEPNRELSDDFVRAVNIGLRALTTAPLWTTFSQDAGRPGLDAGADPRGAWDRVAIDEYDIGCNVLGTLNDELKRRMKPGARRFLIAGAVGGLYSQADPACFENFAYANPDVIAILAFIWRDRWNTKNLSDLGIRSIAPLRAAYTALGKRLTARI